MRHNSSLKKSARTSGSPPRLPETGETKKTSLATGGFLWLFLSLPPIDRIFDSVMAFHMLAQLPLLIVSGILAGRAFAVGADADIDGLDKKRKGMPLVSRRVWASAGRMFDHIAAWDRQGLSSLFFFLGSLAFWMLPVSFDGAVANSLEDLLMHANFFIAGALIPGALSRMSFAVRAASGIYLTAMLASAAMTYLYTESLICNVYTLEMQKETGRLLLWGLPLFFLIHGVTLFRSLRLHKLP